MSEAKSAGGQPGAGRLGVVLYTQTFKIDGSVAAAAPHEAILKTGVGPLIVYDCKVYDRLQKDKFVFGVSRMEVLVAAVEVILPREAITKEGVFSAS